MKILLIGLVDYSKVTGGFVHQVSLARAIKAADHEVIILSPWRCDISNVPADMRECITFTPTLTRLGLPPSFDTFGQLFPLLRIILRTRPDGAITRANFFSFLIQILLRALRVPAISEHNSWLATERRITKRGQVAAALQERLQVLDARLSFACRTVTDNIGQKLRSCGVPHDKIHVIGNGADPVSFYPIPANECRAAFALPTERFIVGFAGTMTVWHGLETAVRAMTIVAKRRTDVDLVLFGDGPDQSRVQRIANELQLHDRVRFLGRVPFTEINRAINCFDVAIAPFTAYRNKESGIAAIKLGDYAAAGKPVIASELPGTLELVPRGWLITTPPDDPGALAEKILDLAQDRDRRSKMSLAARADAEGPMSWEAISEHVITLLKALNRR